jgi:hypothetical protein
MFGRLIQSVTGKNSPTGRIITYEIMSFYDKRWVIDCVMDDEELAIERARSLLLDEKNEQVKVTRQRAMKSGFTTEKIVFEQARPPKGKKEIGLSASINAAPPCASLEDLFALDARVVMGRVFREFLDKLVITPSELLHNYSYIKKLDATGNLISGAVFQIGQAQANAGLGNVKDLVNSLHRLVDEAKMLARDTLAERKRLPVLEDGQFGLLCRRAEARFEPAERGYMIMTALTNYLAGSQSWGQKFEKLGKLFSDDVDADGTERLDGVIADVLGSGEMVQDLLGSQANRGRALALLADLALGRLATAPAQASESLKLLVALIAGRGLPASRRVLFDRLKRELKGTKALCRGDLTAERAAIAELEAKLRDDKGEPIGGAEVTAAFAARREEIRKAHLRKAGVAT